MTTKLVYVLTCAPEANYIEQALMSVWSARHWNPDAHIVLITDNLTDKLFVGKRAEILNYISEKIVVPFEDDSLSMMYRSRWIKTSVRQLIKEAFLFIDCDTIVCKALEEIDSLDCIIGAVRDSNILFDNDPEKTIVCDKVARLCGNVSKERIYFSSGVLFVSDNDRTLDFYLRWHTTWLKSFSIGIPIDQPSFAKVNVDFGHIVSEIDDMYNCVLYTQNTTLPKSKIIHLPSLMNSCFLFSKPIYESIQKEGMQWCIEYFIKNVHSTYLPFNYWIKHSSFRQRLIWICHLARVFAIYGKYIDNTFAFIDFKVRINKFIRWLLHKRMVYVAICFWILWKRLQLFFEKRELKENICSR